MLNDTFKARYTTIPFATFARDHTAGSRQRNIENLSHMHREMELLLVLNGRARFYNNATSYDISAGDLVVVSPWCLHRSTIFADTDFRHICLCFELSLLHDSNLQRELESGNLTVTPVIRSADRYAPFVLGAFSAHTAQKDGWELQTAGNLSILFGLLQEDSHILGTHAPSGDGFSRQVMDYIAAHYPESITSSDAARALHISPSHFCRTFRAAFGHPFQYYLCVYRIEQAKLLLRNTSFPISQVASLVGFSGFSYFSKVFREHTGTTPSEYRSRQ